LRIAGFSESLLVDHLKGVSSMKKLFLLMLLGLISGLGGALASETPEEVLKAVVKIRAVIPSEARTASTLGTVREGHGILIDPKGLILTTGYLILESELIEVTGPDGGKTNALFVGYDYVTGLGLLRAEGSLEVEPMKLGDSSKLQEGDPVIVAGFGGMESAIGARVITRREFTGSWEYILEDAIYTSPPYAGFGGAALIGADGRLLGVGSLFTNLAVQGLGALPCNVFIPIDSLPPILKDLQTIGRPQRPARPWLGINAEEAHGRVFITRVTKGGPAEEAGLQPSDLILKVNGKTVEGLSDFYRKLWALGDAGVEVVLNILKGTEIRDLSLRSGDRHQFLQLKPKKTI
jgi:S1-C subfamily serine protease